MESLDNMLNIGKEMKQGVNDMIHIYCGDGKGKTSAALGLAVRAAGRGKQVLIARFLKSEDSGEVIALRQIKEIEVIPCEKTFGFYKNMTKEVRQEAKEYYEKIKSLYPDSNQIENVNLALENLNSTT